MWLAGHDTEDPSTAEYRRVMLTREPLFAPEFKFVAAVGSTPPPVITGDPSKLSQQEESSRRQGSGTDELPGVPADSPRVWFYPPQRLGPFSWQTRRSIGNGLPNNSNVCFLNAIMQSLAYCVPLAEDCLSGRHGQRCPTALQGQVCGYCLFEKQIQMILTGKDSSTPEAIEGSRKYRHQNYSPRGDPEILKLNSNCFFRPTRSSGVPSGAPGGVTILRRDFQRLVAKELRLHTEGGGWMLDSVGWYGNQHCAHEYLTHLFDFLVKYDLPESCRREFQIGKLCRNRLETTYLHQLFSSNCQDTKTCTVCGNSSTVSELATYFRVFVVAQRDLKMALHASFASECLGGSNKPMCESCGIPQEKVAFRRISRPPNICTIMVQRVGVSSNSSSSCSGVFSRKTKGGCLQGGGPNGRFRGRFFKVLTKLEVPMELSLDEYLTPESKQGLLERRVQTDDSHISVDTDSRPGNPPEKRKSLLEESSYRLIAAVVHGGSGVSYGHYWAVVRGPDDHFYKIDDETVSFVRPSALRGELEESFLLFYQRRTPVVVESHAPATMYSELLNESNSQLPDTSIMRVLGVPKQNPSSGACSLRVATHRASCGSPDKTGDHYPSPPTTADLEITLAAVLVTRKAANTGGEISGFEPPPVAITPVAKTSSQISSKIKSNRFRLGRSKTSRVHRAGGATRVGKRLQLVWSSRVQRLHWIRRISLNSIAASLARKEVIETHYPVIEIGSPQSLSGGPKSLSSPVTVDPAGLQKSVISSAGITKLSTMKVPAVPRDQSLIQSCDSLGLSEVDNSTRSTTAAAPAACADIAVAHCDSNIDSAPVPNCLPTCQNRPTTTRHESDRLGRCNAATRSESFNADLWLGAASCTSSQFGVTDVGLWESDECIQTADDVGSDSKTSAADAFQAIQTILLPKSTKRSRHDIEYDQGKAKKNRSATNQKRHHLHDLCTQLNRCATSKLLLRHRESHSSKLTSRGGTAIETHS